MCLCVEEVSGLKGLYCPIGNKHGTGPTADRNTPLNVVSYGQDALSSESEFPKQKKKKFIIECHLQTDGFCL